MSSDESKDPEKFSGESSSDDDEDAMSSEMIRQMLQLRLGAGPKKDKPKVK